MAALTSKTGSTCPAFPSRCVPGLPGGLEELSQEQQMTGRDVPVQGLQGRTGTSDHLFDSTGLTEAHRRLEQDLTELRRQQRSPGRPSDCQVGQSSRLRSAPGAPEPLLPAHHQLSPTVGYTNARGRAVAAVGRSAPATCRFGWAAWDARRREAYGQCEQPSGPGQRQRPELARYRRRGPIGSAAAVTRTRELVELWRSSRWVPDDGRERDRCERHSRAAARCCCAGTGAVTPLCQCSAALAVSHLRRAAGC